MSLPEAWVEKVFTKLSLVYGHQFLSRWDGLDLAHVKADWAHELAAYQQAPQAIAFALENLPQKPPTVLEFRALCQRAPSRNAQQQRIGHDATPADPERVREAVGYLRGRLRQRDPREWAHNLKARHDAGQKLSPYQIACYRDALRAPAEVIA